MIRKIVITASLGLSLCSAAADAAPNVYGLGNTSCGSYLSARQLGPTSMRAQVYLTWLTGYLTALGQQLPEADEKIARSDPDGWSEWLDNYCHQQPNDSFNEGAYALVKSLLAHE